MMKKKVNVSYTAKVKRFGKMGEKTNWMYIEVPARMAEEINPGCKKSFRVKGLLADYKIEKTALLPMGEGTFIIPFNAQMRKGTGKTHGDTLNVDLRLDESVKQLNSDLLQCIADEPEALKFFNRLPQSHKGYFSKWVDDAKTSATKARRVAESVNALALHKKLPDLLSERNGGENYYARWKAENKFRR